MDQTDEHWSSTRGGAVFLILPRVFPGVISTLPILEGTQLPLEKWAAPILAGLGVWGRRMAFAEAGKPKGWGVEGKPASSGTRECLGGGEPQLPLATRSAALRANNPSQ